MADINAEIVIEILWSKSRWQQQCNLKDFKGHKKQKDMAVWIELGFELFPAVSGRWWRIRDESLEKLRAFKDKNSND